MTLGGSSVALRESAVFPMFTEFTTLIVNNSSVVAAVLVQTCVTDGTSVRNLVL